MWTLWCRVCRLHQPTFTPTYWRTPLFGNRQALKERPRSGNHRRPYQQLFRFKEVQRKTGVSYLWNWTHNQTPYAQNYLFNLWPLHVYFTFYRLARYILSCQFLFFLLENDDMESSKRIINLLSLIFIIRCWIDVVLVLTASSIPML